MIMGFNENGVVEARDIRNPLILDEPISIETAQGKFYYLFDGLGSVTGLTDNGGNLVATYGYDAFGNILSETGDATLNAINPYRFTSRVYDKESGLYYYRARYYDAKTGRFTQKDPLRSELREGKNLYIYCGNNPVNWIDPLGLWGWHWPKLKFDTNKFLRNANYWIKLSGIVGTSCLLGFGLAAIIGCYWSTIGYALCVYSALYFAIIACGGTASAVAVYGIIGSAIHSFYWG